MFGTERVLDFMRHGTGSHGVGRNEHHKSTGGVQGSLQLSSPVRARNNIPVGIPNLQTRVAQLLPNLLNKIAVAPGIAEEDIAGPLW